MLLADLTPANLKEYPELAKKLVRANQDLVGRLPLPFGSLLLREAIGYDWKFPAERREIESDLNFLKSLTPAEFEELTRPFAAIRLSAELQQADWVGDPVGFAEKLSAHLWSTGQIDAFRAAAVVYMDRRVAARPSKPAITRRLTMVLMGEGASDARLPLFRKLRAHGTHFSNIRTRNSLSVLLSVAGARASKFAEPFGHWLIDGGYPPDAPTGVSVISYGGLEKARTMLQQALKSAYEKKLGSESIRSQLAQMRPEQLGFSGKGDQAVLDRFALSILTEGSGTQIYSTTFVQWAVREASRRSQPLTILARFRARQREKSMQELLTESERAPDPDAVGGLRDADMGAYYAWLSQQRLPASENSGFLAMVEGGNEALAIGPGIRRGLALNEAVTIEDLIAIVTG